MSDDNKNGNLHFSRSGRMLRKSLKMKEMEEIEESKEENKYDLFPTSSDKIEIRRTMNSRGVHKGSRSSSSASSSSLCTSVSVDDSFNCETKSKEMKNEDQYADPDSNDATYFQMGDDNYSVDTSKIWSSDSSIEESNGSTYDANYSPKYLKSRFKTNASLGKCLENLSSGRIITKSLRSATRKSIGSKTRKNRRGTKFNPKSLCKSYRSLKKSSHVLPEKDTENVGGASGYQFSRDQFAIGCGSVERSKQSAGLNFDSDMLEDSEQVTKHPLRISPIDVAAHLKLLGDNLSRIGYALMMAQQDVNFRGAYDVLLVSLLCAVGPLLCLTKEIPGLEGIKDDVFIKTLDHIAYIMPGL